MDFRQAADFLDGLQYFKIKLGLSSIRAFLGELGNPQEGLRFIHVGGTNGKGSVAATLHEILKRAGYRVGVFTSPHLSCVRERFRVNDRFILERDFAREAGRIAGILAGRQITYFECTTALALLWFASEEVDLAIMEVGLGGRLDATNVITPLVSVITNVAMDHELHLGDTLEKIAAEKAGIIKPGVPVVSGVDAGAGREVLERTCRAMGAPFHLLGRDFYAVEEGDAWTYRGLTRRFSGLRCRLSGAHQRGNAAQALAVVELLAGAGVEVGEVAVRNGLAEVRWPGRLEQVVAPAEPADGSRGAAAERESFRRLAGRRFLLDGAHNPAGVQALLGALRSGPAYRDLILVWAGMADKDLVGMLAMVAPACRAIVFTRPPGERAASPDQLCRELPAAFQGAAYCVPEVRDALVKAAELAGVDDLICVAGSLYLVGAARRLLVGEIVEA